MVELTQEQLRALDEPEQPPMLVDPRTGQQFLLIRKEIHDKVRSILRPYGKNWDNPADDDLIQGSLPIFSIG